MQRLSWYASAPRARISWLPTATSLLSGKICFRFLTLLYVASFVGPQSFEVSCKERLHNCVVAANNLRKSREVPVTRSITLLSSWIRNLASNKFNGQRGILSSAATPEKWTWELILSQHASSVESVLEEYRFAKPSWWRPGTNSEPHRGSKSAFSIWQVSAGWFLNLRLWPTYKVLKRKSYEQKIFFSLLVHSVSEAAYYPIV